MPCTTRSTEIRLISAVGSPGKSSAMRATAADLVRSKKVTFSLLSCSASWARPKTLTGAFTTLVSPRLLPARDSPITIAGQSCTTLQAPVEHVALGFDRGHRLGQLVIIVVEVARENDFVFAGEILGLAAVDVGGLDRQVGHEGRAGGACSCSEKASAFKVPVTLARNEVGYGSSKATLAAQWITWVRVFFSSAKSSGETPRLGSSTSPAMKRNFFASSAPASQRRLQAVARRAAAG